MIDDAHETEEKQAPPAPDEVPEGGVLRRVYDGLAAHFRLLAADRTVVCASLIAAVVLTASRYHLTTSEYNRTFGTHRDVGGLFTVLTRSVFGEGPATWWVKHATSAIPEYLWWFLGSTFLFLLVPLLVAALTPGVRIRELGLGLGDWRYGLKVTGVLFAVMLPFVVGASLTGTFSKHYPLAGGAATNGTALLLYELSYAAYFVAWEFVYRGLLCVGLYPRIGAAVIYLHAIPFAVMHGGKPEAEAFGSIVAALALGVVAVRARSFWYGALLHTLVAWTMDVLALTWTHRWPTNW